MTRTTLFAALIAFGAAGAAQAQPLTQFQTQAQDNGPLLVGGGDGPQVIYTSPNTNVVGGGFARLVGEGNSRSIAYLGPTTAQPASGLVARLTGGGREQALVYEPAPAGSASLAGTQVTRPRG